MAQQLLATFAGGCFWCVVAPFKDLSGVKKIVSGYAGGTEKNPSYKEVSSGKTGHVEAVQITYDPELTSYKELLDVFWRQIDPFDNSGQFNDRGAQYKTAIFYHNKKQARLAKKTKQEVEKRFKQSVATKIISFTTFFPAKNSHQDYHEKNPLRYGFYRKASGRDRLIKKTWNGQPSLFDKQYVKPPDTKLQQLLTPKQYEVTQQCGTEPPFDNKYYDHTEPGIYVDVISGEPLFASIHKFDSQTGWPSFTQPIAEKAVTKKKISPLSFRAPKFAHASQTVISDTSFLTGHSLKEQDIV